MLNILDIDCKGIVEQQEKDIVKLKSIIPSIYIIPNTKVSNKLNAILENGEVEIQVNKKGTFTKVSINYNDKNIILPKNFTTYDRTVLNASISLYETGNRELTPGMVYRCMNGLSNNEKVSPQAIETVTRSIDKARRLFCTIDYTEEARNRKKDTDKCTIEGTILNADKIIIQAGRHEVIGYRFNTKPLLYQYAQVSKQIISVPISLLNTKEATRSTNEVIVIRDYLIRRIEVMKKSNKQSNKILYEGIYKEIGKETPIKQKAEKIRNAVKEILNHWKAEKYIKNLKEYKEGRTFKGIEIFY